MPVAAPVRLPCRDFTANPPRALLPLFRAIDALPRPIQPEALAEAIRAFPVNASDLGDAISADPGHYVRTLVRASDDYHFFVMTWVPGQHSPIHDHAGSICCVRIVSGSAVETVYDCDDDGAAHPVKHRRFVQGQVAVSIDRDTHRLGNAVDSSRSAGELLVTLHVYAPPLATRREFSPTPVR